MVLKLRTEPRNFGRFEVQWPDGCQILFESLAERLRETRKALEVICGAARNRLKQGQGLHVHLEDGIGRLHPSSCCHFLGEPLLTRSLRIWLGLKDSTRREQIVIAAPVWGLRPQRACL